MHHLWEIRAPISSLAHVSARRKLFLKEATGSRPCGKVAEADENSFIPRKGSFLLQKKKTQRKHRNKNMIKGSIGGKCKDEETCIFLFLKYLEWGKYMSCFSYSNVLWLYMYIYNFIYLKCHWWSWRVGSVIKRIYCSSTEHEFSSQHLGWFTATYDSSSR